MNRLRADMLLLVTTIIWGTAFIAQKNANENMGPLTFVGAPFLLSALALVPFVLYEAKNQTEPLHIKEYVIAGLIGVCLFAGSSLQQTGLLTTTATHGGFLTALYVVFVPFVVWVTKREPPRLLVVIAGMISIIGAWLLTNNGQSTQWVRGDMLLVVADVGWALAIALVPMFLKRTYRPFFLSCAQYAIMAVLGLIAGFIFESVTMRGVVLALPAILYAGLLSGGMAYTLSILAQRHTPPAEAALIMSLESVFAALAGAVLLNERLTPVAMTGCVLILLGVAVSETTPFLLRKIRIQFH